MTAVGDPRAKHALFTAGLERAEGGSRAPILLPIRTVFEHLRGIDVREFEGASGEVVAGTFSPRTLVALERAIAVLTNLLDHLPRSTGASPPGSGGLPFGLAVDALVKASSLTKVTDVAQLALARLVRDVTTLQQHAPGQNAGIMLCECCDAVRHARKSLSALELALSEMEHRPPRVPFESELRTSLRMRRQFRKVWRRAGDARPTGLEGLRSAVRATANLCALLAGHDVYAHMRHGDRERLRRLQRHIAAWSGTGAETGLRLMDELVELGESLREVNLRQEVLEHDEEALRTAEKALSEGGDAGLAAAREALAGVEGLDPGLDAALSGEPVVAKVLLAETRRVRASLVLPAQLSGATGPTPIPTAAPKSPPLEALARHVAARATGELICVGDGLEVHVFLQSGRVAWGTTTADRFVFRRHLLSRYKVDEHDLQAALAESQRSRRPMGETLVAWGLLTAEQIREGLRAQLVSTLESLERCQGEHPLFLPRGANYATYDAQFTFELEELRAQAGEPSPGRVDE